MIVDVARNIEVCSDMYEGQATREMRSIMGRARAGYDGINSA